VLGHLAPLPDRLRRLGAPTTSRLRRQNELGELAERTTRALDELRTISHGIYPAQLERLGLVTVLSRQSGGQVSVEVDDSLREERFDGRVEAAAYFCVTETLRALGRPARAWLGLAGDDLVLRISGTDTGAGHWSQVRDRAECLGGELTRTAVDDRSVVAVRIPARLPVGAGRS
jgi:signal transduction histidine kinase